MLETTGVKHTRKYAVYGNVYASEGMYIPEWFYIGTFYRCKVFIAQNQGFYGYEEVLGGWSIGWSEEYLEERWDALSDEDERGQKIDALMDEEEADLASRRAKFDSKYRNTKAEKENEPH
tara:strand:+ start:1665 stop:2024 length:360 start_codon:yes stop_codon:yes gene_type:complete